MVGEQQEEATEALANCLRLGRKAVKNQKDYLFVIISYFPIWNFHYYITSDNPVPSLSKSVLHRTVPPLVLLTGKK